MGGIRIPHRRARGSMRRRSILPGEPQITEARPLNSGNKRRQLCPGSGELALLSQTRGFRISARCGHCEQVVRCGKNGRLAQHGAPK